MLLFARYEDKLIIYMFILTIFIWI